MFKNMYYAIIIGIGRSFENRSFKNSSKTG